MARFPQSGPDALRVTEVLSDRDTSLGGLMRHATLLMQLEYRLRTVVDPELAAHFQVAACRNNRLVLITPSASWATRLRMQATALLMSLHQAGYAEIKQIDIRVAPLVVQPAEQRKKKSLSPAARQALDLMGRLKAGEDE